jgi:general stress protein 26
VIWEAAKPIWNSLLNLHYKDDTAEDQAFYMSTKVQMNLILSIFHRQQICLNYADEGFHGH